MDSSSGRGRVLALAPPRPRERQGPCVLGDVLQKALPVRRIADLGGVGQQALARRTDRGAGALLLPGGVERLGAAAAYNAAAWSPDGKRIAAPSDDKTVWVWTDLSPLQGANDPKLWTATTYCLPIDLRHQILGVSEAPAKTDQAACLRRVDAARALAP